MSRHDEGDLSFESALDLALGPNEDQLPEEISALFPNTTITKSGHKAAAAAVAITPQEHESEPV